jgi:hypothetical protein
LPDLIEERVALARRGIAGSPERLRQYIAAG